MSKRKAKALPPKTATQPKPKRPAKVERFNVGDEVEFHLSESADGVRPQGDAVVLKAEPLGPKGKSMTYLLDVKSIFAGKPDSIRNPDGELWAVDGELFKPGTRHETALAETGAHVIANQVAGENPADGFPEGYQEMKFKSGGALLLYRSTEHTDPLYLAYNGDAAVVATLLDRTFEQYKNVAVAAVRKDELESVLERLMAAGHRVAVCEKHGAEPKISEQPKEVEASETDGGMAHSEERAVKAKASEPISSRTHSAYQKFLRRSLA